MREKIIISTVTFLLLLCSICSPLILNVKAENLPDLTVSTITISPQQPYVNQSFMIIITVANIGSGEVPGSYLLFANVTKGTTYVNSISYGIAGNLTQGQSVSLSWDFINGLPAGTYTVTAVADPWHHYAESNEANNVATFIFTVATPDNSQLYTTIEDIIMISLALIVIAIIAAIILATRRRKPTSKQQT
jgi:subtilase family serine protease